MSKAGHNVEIITSSKIHNTNINLIKGDEFSKKISFQDVCYTFLKCGDYSKNGIKRIFSFFEFAYKVRSYMKKGCEKGRPDIIYVSSPDLVSSVVALKLAHKYGIKTILEIRDLWPESLVQYLRISRKNPIIQLLYKIEKYAYKIADRIIFTSEGAKDYIYDKKWDKIVSDEKIYYVNNGVDIKEFNDNIKNYEYKDDILDNNDIFKVVYTGSIRKVNNIMKLVEVAKTLQDRAEDRIIILIFGDGNEIDNIRNEIKKKNLKNIVLRGFVEKKYIPSILSKSNLNIVNVMESELSKYGCSWNKLFEYLASGKPVFSNERLKYDIINKNKAGYSKTINNSDEYADEIIKFLEMDKDLYLNYCNNAKNAARKYDYKYLANKIECIMKGM